MTKEPESMPGPVRRALVLGGGGVAGIAWETGIITGLADAGVDVFNADVVVGTSAGSTVAAQVTAGETAEQLFARQTTSAAASRELAAQLDMDAIAAMFIEALRTSTSATELRSSIGRAAREMDTVPEPVRRAVIEHRLPTNTWPSHVEMHIVAVDATTGDPRVFTGADGVELVDAVAASCAVPGVWPPVSIGGRRYMDGGVRSSTNADLALGCDVVLVLAPSSDVVGIADPEVLADIERLHATCRTLIVRPDDASVAAIGANPLDPETRSPSATAGRAQGRSIAAEVEALWA